MRSRLVYLLLVHLTVSCYSQDTIDIVGIDDQVELSGPWRFYSNAELKPPLPSDQTTRYLLKSEFTTDEEDTIFTGLGWFSKTCYISDSLRGKAVAFVMLLYGWCHGDFPKWKNGRQLWSAGSLRGE